MKNERVVEVLQALGYKNRQIVEDCIFPIDERSEIKFDQVAFCDEYIKDLTTSCIAVQSVKEISQKNYFLERAKYAATPILIFAEQEQAEIWNITAIDYRLIAAMSYFDLSKYCEDNRFDFSSNAIFKSKTEYKQLSLFDVTGLLEFAENSTCKILGEEFERSLYAGKRLLQSSFAPQKPEKGDYNNLTSITMHILSAKIITHKLNRYINDDIHAIIKKLSQDYENYFSESLLYHYGKELVDAIYDELSSNINYSNVNHELLGYFYESTLFEYDHQKKKKTRKDFGIYYTPKALSEEVCKAIPFENLREEQRVVLDASCGSGSLLISACKRLEKLLSPQTDGFAKHNYLTSKIIGFDVDRFATEVSRLSLLLYSLPFGNRWNITTRDSLKIRRFPENIPSIVIGNPPYEEKREKHKKSQRATEFVDKYISWINKEGYLGIILPESFLQNDSAIQTRKRMLKCMDIIEIWTLPGMIFQNNCPTTVIIARKSEPTPGFTGTKIRTVIRNKLSIRRFLEKRAFDLEYFVDKQDLWRNQEKPIIAFSFVDKILDNIKSEKTLGECATVISGIMLPKNYPYLHYDPYMGSVKYLFNARNFQEYYINPLAKANALYLDYDAPEEKVREFRKKYKGLRLRKAYKAVYEAPSKVLIKINSTPAELNCICAFIDNEQYFPSHSFCAICPNIDSGLSSQIICALLNSNLINAYVRRKCVKRTLTYTVIKEVPIPSFSDLQKNEIEKNVNEIEHALQKGDFQHVEELKYKIDILIYKAFGLEKDDIEQLLHFVSQFKSCGTGIKEERNTELERSYGGTSILVSGLVQEVDIKNQRCKVELAEIDGQVWVKFDNSAPGWFIRNKARFSAYLDSPNYVLTQIKPLRYSYMTEEEVLDKVLDSVVPFGEAIQ